MLMRNKLLLCTLFMLGAASTPALAEVSIGVEIAVPPPAARVEIVPPPRPGFYWAPGYWRWEGSRHAWVEGRWIEDRPGYSWVPDRWLPRANRHQFHPGHWERDEHRDHERDRHG
jgi:hypothetical protein